MVLGLIVLLLCQLVGELVVRTLDVTLPGPVLGMVLYFVVLQVRRPPTDAPLVRGAQTLLRHLPLLYVPAGAGVISYLAVLGGNAVPIAGGLILSWVAGLLVTAGGAALVLRSTGQPKVLR